MKKFIVILVMMAFSIAIHTRATAQSEEAQQLLLNVEKLAQLKSILKNLYKGYEIVSKGYNTIKDLSEGNFSLHKQFLDGLLAVSPTVRQYKKVGDIVSIQLRLVDQHKVAFKLFKSDGNFTLEELNYISKVYSGVVNESLQNIEDLVTVVTAGKLRMSDEERLTAIDRIYDDVSGKAAFLQQFNNRTKILAIQRAKAQNDVRTLRNIYGLK